MIARLLWGLLALLHLAPAAAFMLPSLITSLYGVETGGTSFALLHHRAALFLVVVVMCIWAMVDPAVRRLASVGVAISVLSFLAIYSLAGFPAALETIAWADLAGVPVLLVAGWLAWTAPAGTP